MGQTFFKVSKAIFTKGHPLDPLLYFILTFESLFCSNDFSGGSDMCPQQGKWPWGY